MVARTNMLRLYNTYTGNENYEAAHAVEWRTQKNVRLITRITSTINVSTSMNTSSWMSHPRHPLLENRADPLIVTTALCIA